ncbi:hypothetical protein [Halorussus halobius]|uniref:hypothetical protein n=1 Tax=Halorussus halobius TaxID=1710537 RepID=UPI001093217C|nr:hypothetical protein [Halorussus halobius]
MSVGVPTSIRSILLASLLLSTAGCTAISNPDDAAPGDSSTTPECELTHELVEPSDGSVDATETYAYENLSSDARHAFDEVLADGSYSTTNRSLQSSEFRYWDTTTSYNVTYRNETYKLLTYSGSGCER